MQLTDSLPLFLPESIVAMFSKSRCEMTWSVINCMCLCAHVLEMPLIYLCRGDASRSGREAFRRVPSSVTRVFVLTQKLSSHHKQTNENTELIGIIGYQECWHYFGCSCFFSSSSSFLISCFEIIPLYSKMLMIFSKIQ